MVEGLNASRIPGSVQARAAHALVGLDPPRPQRDHLAAHAQRETDLRQRPVTPTHRNHRVRAGDHDEVAHHAEAGRDRDADVLIGLGEVLTR